MLSELHIRDFAIIDELHLSFAPGFTVLTGETGAGKSIIIDAVSLVLGGRADPTMVRAGADRALVEAVFRLELPRREAIRPILEREGLEGDEPDLLVLSREVRAEGRSICRINGRAVTLSLLREVAEGLVDIHGQSEHLSLLRVREHVFLLDRFAGLEPLRARVADLVGRIRAVRRERAALEQDEKERARRIDLLQYQITEIEAANLRPGEEEELAEERVRLANAEHLALLLAEALRALDEGGTEGAAATDLLGRAVRALEGLARIDGALAPRLQEAEELLYRLQDLADSLRDYRRRVEYNPRRLAEVEERLDHIRRLKRKYGATIAEVLEYARRAAEELETITHSEERIAELAAQEEQLLAELAHAALELSARRREAARRLAAGIERELQDLRMAGARFGVDFRWEEDPEGIPLTPDLLAQYGLEGPELLPGRVAFDATGIDRVEFLVSPNPGEPLKPLAKIASGGETSRLMLALKAVLSRVDETPTLIFDEIDQGIGGRVGATVGEKLWRLSVAGPDGSLAHQVLCVTHLPQLAGFGDRHLRVEKVVADGRTVTRVTVLEGPARVEELAQMLGASGESAYRSAEEILEEARGRKQGAGSRE
ncbi:MAG: DNA repair protein RecN [Anaerolineae bacterium]|nr:DNA repair protein RecN [Anaerolineae bacterium]MCX8066615.1 DNA repair protein RecN [Anaerolineae bacterium]MDW7991082.1 DNA repair protein RecN [Anaerolineae bacterium]